ncbi:hypothetical protein DV451_000930 [Geotrichum candidum]|nr:hypothetical protein DV451_000930 [Geotrichum candidum]KAI9214928.1 hypothetical protein DS838_000259 [Geotrichum bryndzae]KAF5106942.1 hypothetical protein DV453_003547 [Geotrichum candidum]KAF5123225.1 hypothetical protein DV452_000277 [Geotrichum candidum]KAF5135338.1 hypothetical protein DV495_000968 [Geotrichum candidum]
MVSFFLLVAPLPDKVRKSAILFLRNNPLVSKVALGLRFTFFFIFILFADSVNRVYRVQREFAPAEAGGHGAGMPAAAAGYDRNELQARRFYAQRNMYLCGFTLFLSLILLRTATLVFELADAREALKGTNASDGDEVKALKETIRKQELDIEHLKKQSEGLSREYNKVSDELNEKSGVQPSDKKLD